MEMEIVLFLRGDSLVDFSVTFVIKSTFHSCLNSLLYDLISAFSVACGRDNGVSLRLTFSPCLGFM